ncbi:MAG: hypothetical protein COW00_15215 [Bdellovibrio sp. CG12_big_fil_rev_8_21_14_0_65_39_13]|nr:MAG: hypothetical protein COW78_05685 [Bdellovibrio sp. CG22_combo_CG10-13_8_21_14_all_39_27]PIQ58468.1 MAG: hypothetical protein COW00_15215 [Bdellovibrio sp. CG12_big_fil_rev_8_21_14_0_65_39_13]PIR35419.1 MAG: hypothetical protein COV37_08035 [Bdellovibrio sp. CG11_big_fil_rev_8_21_14_0_20_39_38]
MKYLATMKQVLEMEAKMLLQASERLKQTEINQVVDLFGQLQQWGGQFIICGVGKSGLIAQKIAATFSSLGMPSTFLHPVEALHGDLGRVRKNDVIVLISKSGTTEEIIKLLPFLPMDKNHRIALVGDPHSPIAQESGVVLDCSIEKEACLNNQAPTTSSTLALAMGDALAVVFEQLTNMTKEKFATFHPGGLLGKSMLMKTRDLMISRDLCAHVNETATLKDVILEMTKKPVGGCAVVDSNFNLLGIVVEGDIRRTLANHENALQLQMQKIMKKNPITIEPMTLAKEALVIMEKRANPISLLPVIEEGIFVGFLRLHDLLKEGFSSDQ